MTTLDGKSEVVTNYFSHSRTDAGIALRLNKFVSPRLPRNECRRTRRVLVSGDRPNDAVEKLSAEERYRRQEIIHRHPFGLEERKNVAQHRQYPGEGTETGEVQRGGVTQVLTAVRAGTNERREYFTQGFKYSPRSGVEESAQIVANLLGTTRHRAVQVRHVVGAGPLARFAGTRGRTGGELHQRLTRDRRRDVGCSQQLVSGLIIQHAHKDNVARLDGGENRGGNLSTPREGR